jgi:hypothetical protein
MATKKKELARFTAEIMDSAVDTVGGIRFTETAVLAAYARIASEGCTVEDLAIPERTRKGVRPDDPWKGHAMARSVSASIDGTVLRVEFSVPDTRYGKLLMATADTAGGFDRIRFIPVGQGVPDKDNRVDSFRLSYVTFKSGLKA